MGGVKPPDPDEMLERVMALPVVARVADRLGAEFTPRVALVGGAVRDLLLGGPVVDIDLAVEGDVDAVVSRLGAEVRAHDRFGTATLVLAGAQVDLAATRRERYVRPGALPDVEPASLEEDLGRRDFTVNAIAVPLTGEGRGAVLAVPEALEDLEHRRLRVLHDGSFEDDPTRLLRMARYAARLGFELEPATRQLVERAVAEGALSTVSGPRLGNELRLIATEPDPITPWDLLRDWGMDEAIAPGFGLRDPGLAARAVGMLPPDGAPEVVVLALAVAGMSSEGSAVLLDRLGFPADLRDPVLRVAGRSAHVAEVLTTAQAASEIARVIEEGRGEGTVELAAVAGALGPEGPARLWLERLRHVRLEIDGDDLVAEGIDQGPAIGVGLAAARAAALDGDAETRAEQLEVALRAAQGAG